MVPDPSRPSLPGLYECLLSGHDCLPADRAAVAGLLEVDPGLRDLARANREFVVKAARWTAAMLGVAQFADIGCGFPQVPSVHGEVRGPRPGARIAYVDNDPLVVCHVQSVAAEEGWGGGIAVVAGDAREPGKVLADAGLLEVIDLAVPACVIFGATLSTMTAAEAREAVAGFTGRLAAGSAVIISCVSYRDPETAGRLAEVTGAAGEWHNHGLADVASFFGSLRIITGRAGDVHRWPMVPQVREVPAAVLGGVGIKGLVASFRLKLLTA